MKSMYVACAMVLVLAGCATQPGAGVLAANDRRATNACVADAWLTPPAIRSPGVRYDHGHPSRRETRPVVPPPASPDLASITRQCQ
jgi:hypothetical protein